MASSPIRRGDGVSCFRCGEVGHFGRDCSKTSNVCYRCNEEGHIAKLCPNAEDAQSRDDITCYKCQGQGHLAKNCPYTEDADGKPLPRLECFNCHRDGHLAKNCPEAKSETGGGPGVCFTCNRQGHLARDCPSRTSSAAPAKRGGSASHVNVREIVFEAVHAALRDRGFTEEQRDDMARESAQSAGDFIEGKTRGRGPAASGPAASVKQETLSRSVSMPPSSLANSNSTCFKCGKPGHFSRDCPLAGKDKCYRCLEEGHRSKECPNPRARSRTPRRGGNVEDRPRRSSNTTCFRCGGMGHFGRECPHEKDVCFTCRKEGHRSTECPERR